MFQYIMYIRELKQNLTIQKSFENFRNIIGVLKMVILENISIRNMTYKKNKTFKNIIKST